MFVTLMQPKVLLEAATDAGSGAVADGFCATRLAGTGWGAVYGAGEAPLDAQRILDRAWSGATA
jgi:hypothetical protein